MSRFSKVGASIQCVQADQGVRGHLPSITLDVARGYVASGRLATLEAPYRRQKGPMPSSKRVEGSAIFGCMAVSIKEALLKYQGRYPWALGRAGVISGGRVG